MDTNEAVAANQKVKVVKGCKRLGISKGTTFYVNSVTPMGAEFNHSVKVAISGLNGFTSGQKFGLHASHMNRLSDSVIRLSGLRPSDYVEVVRA